MQTNWLWLYNSQCDETYMEREYKSKEKKFHIKFVYYLF